MDLFELEAVLRLNTTEFDKGISSAEESGTGLITKIGTAWTKAKSKFQTVSTILKPVTDLIGDVVDKYSNYQQLTGGIDKLFGESAEKVRKNAKAAFSAAGMSINDYLEMTTSMASSLIQGLEGDTETAADLVNMAVIDMADNVNTFGRSVEDVQNAYRGLARGNYTMLDNLSLGYQGTAAEMERLMEDAAALDEEFANSAVFGLDEKGHLNANYADMIRAIHIIQQNMGITGTTMNESANTVSGSRATMKAALDNLKTIMGDPKATQEEIQDATKAFTDSLTQFLKNIEPIITTAVQALIKVIGTLLESPEARDFINVLIKGIAQALPGIVGELAQVIVKLLSDPALLVSLVNTLAFAVVSGLAALFDILLSGILGIFDDSYRKESAFNQWGVYDFLSIVFGMDSELIKKYKTAEETKGTGIIGIRDNAPGTESQVLVHTNAEGKQENIAVEYEEGQLDALKAAVHAVEELYGIVMTPEQIQNMARAGLVIPWSESQIEQMQNVQKGDIDVQDGTVYFNGNVSLLFTANQDYFNENFGPYAQPHAKGLWDVPYDDYYARLHRDEMVLTASQARDYREGRTDGSSDVVAAVQRLGNELANLKIIVGEKVFGQTVVDYGGKGMNNYLGKSESRAYAGYGWG